MTRVYHFCDRLYPCNTTHIILVQDCHGINLDNTFLVSSRTCFESSHAWTHMCVRLLLFAFKYSRFNLNFHLIVVASINGLIVCRSFQSNEIVSEMTRNRIACPFRRSYCHQAFYQALHRIFPFLSRNEKFFHNAKAFRRGIFFPLEKIIEMNR